MQLEDDITAKPQYITSMKHYAASLDRWELLEFSQLGFIGQILESIYSIYRLTIYTEFNIASWLRVVKFIDFTVFGINSRV